jgi:hypothetical protein
VFPNHNFQLPITNYQWESHRLCNW